MSSKQLNKPNTKFSKTGKSSTWRKWTRLIQSRYLCKPSWQQGRNLNKKNANADRSRKKKTNTTLVSSSPISYKTGHPRVASTAAPKKSQEERLMVLRVVRKWAVLQWIMNRRRARPRVLAKKALSHQTTIYSSNKEKPLHSMEQTRSSSWNWTISWTTCELTTRATKWTSCLLRLRTVRRYLSRVLKRPGDTRWWSWVRRKVAYDKITRLVLQITIKSPLVTKWMMMKSQNNLLSRPRSEASHMVKKQKQRITNDYYFIKQNNYSQINIPLLYIKIIINNTDFFYIL